MPLNRQSRHEQVAETLPAGLEHAFIAAVLSGIYFACMCIGLFARCRRVAERQLASPSVH